MKWTKPSAETIAYFERIAPGPPIEARTMFGMPARFLNGHMLVGVFGDTFMLHLSQKDREECIRAGAKPFAPMGREAKAYVDVKPGLFEDRTLKEWIVRGMRYLASLPPKLTTKAAPSSRRNGTGAERAASSKRNGGTVQGAASSRRNGGTAERAAVSSKRGGAGAERAAVGSKRAGAGAERSGIAKKAKKGAKTAAASKKAAAPKAKLAAGARRLRATGERAKKPSPKSRKTRP